MLDETMLAGFEVDGMRPARQARSRQLLVRLFNDGLRLLQETDFEGLSIETLCARSGSTVGAFYSRFDSKDAFIDALQRLVVAESRRNIFELQPEPPKSLAHLLAWSATHAVTWYQRYEGLIRASLRRSNGEREMWTPMRELGALRIARTLPKILAFVPPQARAGAEKRARFAFQILFGTLNNMVLIDPGPFGINDPETPKMLASAMIELIERTPRVADVGSATIVQPSRSTGAATSKTGIARRTKAKRS